MRRICKLSLACLCSCVACSGLLFQSATGFQDRPIQDPAIQDRTTELPQVVPAIQEDNSLIDDVVDPAIAADQDVAEVDAAIYQQTVAAGIDYLIHKGQAEDGSFTKDHGPAVTGMCVMALMKHGLPVESVPVTRGLAYLEQFVQEDGGVYNPGGTLRNYETSVAIMCFVQANADGMYDQKIERAVGFIKGLQWDEGEGKGLDSPFYGGFGYGKHARPDLSNTSFAADALEAAGEDPDSKAMQNMKAFLSRCQNLQTPDNAEEFTQDIKPDDEGGMIYTPVGPESKATWDEENEGGAVEGGAVEGVDGEPGNVDGEDLGAQPDQQKDVGGLRSYASMTYAGLKSLLYAGLEKDDLRVQAARDWISRHYDLQSNPGMGQQGLYYYYHVFGKTLDANGERLIVDSDGVAHNWRADLVLELHAKQLDDGSWVNEADRWYEGDPNLVTSYALLGLEYCSPDKDK